jgi:putative MATE family efflux protein
LNNSIGRQITRFFNDREYFQLLVKFTLPIALQNLVMASLNLVAGVMIGQLGENSVAAVGQANQVLFLLNLVVFGVVSGAAMFLAQLWGKRDVSNIRRVLGLTIKLSLLAALFFWALAIFIPKTVLNIYSDDPVVIAIGSEYLRIACWSYFFLAITAAYGVALRSIGNVRLPLVVSISALVFNIALAYPLIFGWEIIHLPAMGVKGAAIALILARALESLAMLGLVYRRRSDPLAATLKDIFNFDWKFIKATMKPVLPVIANEVLWSFGITTYFAIYGHIGNGTNAVAAINIVGTIDQMAFVLFIGVGTATSIIVGHAIGRGEPDKAFIYAGRSLCIQVIGAILMGVLIYLFAGNIFQFYKVDPVVIEDARKILLVMSLGLWIRAANHVIILGILRSGGDSRFSLFLDGFIIWLVGVPVTAAGAFWFGLPVQFVYALTFSEEITKMLFGTWRYFSRKWIHNLTERISIV